MDVSISITGDGVRRYPPHRHERGEIMTYLSGRGYLYTPEKNYEFEPGTIIFVPPGIVHGSVSENGFCNISIGADFEGLMPGETPVLIRDNREGDGIALAKIIYNNRYADSAFLHSLCTSFACFFARRADFKNDSYAAISAIVEKINNNAFDTMIDLCKILNQSCYSEDYIRAKFKQHIGKTPTEFLTEIRMRRAVFLINVYGKRLSMQEIALKCGYCDYVYFSKRFKKFAGCSPSEYQKRVGV